MNNFIKENEKVEIPILEIRNEVHNEQVKRINELRLQRNNDHVHASLSAITDACSKETNLMPLIIDAAKSYTTMGEIVDAMKVVFGEWEENTVL